MPKAKINDTELYYDQLGSGTPFLLMHGGPGIDHTYFRPFLEPLSDIFQLIFYDHRGHGRSGRPPINTITFEKLADDATALRELLGFNKIGVIGNSAGGFVALNYAIRYPKNLSYLILLDTAPAFDYMEEMMATVMKKNPKPEVIEALNAPVASTAEGFREQFRIMQPLYFYEFNSENEVKINKITDKMIFNHEAAAVGEKLLLNYDVSSQLNEIEVPTLILVGEDDFICPPSQAQRMHDSIPNSELYVFKKCGHYPFYEVPDEFFRIVRDWFKKVHKK